MYASLLPGRPDVPGGPVFPPVYPPVYPPHPVYPPPDAVVPSRRPGPGKNETETFIFLFFVHLSACSDVFPCPLHQKKSQVPTYPRC